LVDSSICLTMRVFFPRLRSHSGSVFLPSFLRWGPCFLNCISFHLITRTLERHPGLPHLGFRPSFFFFAALTPQRGPLPPRKTSQFGSSASCACRCCPARTLLLILTPRLHFLAELHRPSPFSDCSNLSSLQLPLLQPWPASHVLCFSFSSFPRAKARRIILSPFSSTFLCLAFDVSSLSLPSFCL